ncbi:hypothetical protein ES703_113832 [subsurface metagenome]
MTIPIFMYQSLCDKYGIINSQSEYQGTDDDIKKVQFEPCKAHDTQSPYPTYKDRKEGNDGSFNTTEK